MRETWSSWSAVSFGEEAREWHSSPTAVGSPIGRSEVAADRLVRILERLVSAGVSPSEPGPLCQVAADLVVVTGAGVMILADGVPQASLCTTGSVSELIEDLQYTLGEGPCIDAYRTGAPISEPNLVTPVSPRWPAFTPKVIDVGARAIFGFPVRIGAARIGALNLYRDQPGPLSDDQHADALVMADVIARTVLTLQSRTEPGSTPLDFGTDIHAVVHQAAGMVSVQLDIRVADALVRLRAHAYATDRPLNEVAGDVVARTLRFDDLDGR
jgi:GAF domain